MELLSVRCNHCGAPLEVGAHTRFVTCQFCHSQLEVKHTDSSSFTEVVQQLAASTAQMAGNLRVIELQNELQRLDREWASERERFNVTGRNGRVSRPSSPATILAIGVAAAGFMIFWINRASSLGAPRPFVMFGIIGLVVVIANVLSSLNKSCGLGRAETAYQQQRMALLASLETARHARE